MAIVKGPLQLSGGMKGVSFYTPRGSDKVIMRSKGGPSKEKVRHSPQFEGVRKQQTEWGGCARFGSAVRAALGGLSRLADYNLTPPLNGIGKKLMKMDTEGETGRRCLSLSAFPEALDSFPFNRHFPFNSVFRVFPKLDLEAASLTVSAEIPRIRGRNDLWNVQQLPYFRLLLSIGLVSDLEYQPQTGEYLPLVPDVQGVSSTLQTEWHLSESNLDPMTLTVSLSDDERALLNERVTIVVSMGIEFGKVGFTGEPEAVKYAGCGKVMKVGRVSQIE